MSQRPERRRAGAGETLTRHKNTRRVHDDISRGETLRGYDQPASRTGDGIEGRDNPRRAADDVAGEHDIGAVRAQCSGCGYVVGERAGRNHLRPLQNAGGIVFLQPDVLSVANRVEREIRAARSIHEQPSDRRKRACDIAPPEQRAVGREAHQRDAIGLPVEVTLWPTATKSPSGEAAIQSPRKRPMFGVTYFATGTCRPAYTK